MWLSDHPEICASKVKEPFFLMDKGHPLLNSQKNVHEDGLAGYEHFFDHCPDKKIKIEATTHYIYQRTALRVLSRLDHPPKVVFLLRNPADRVYSSFKYTKHNLARLPESLSFAEFVQRVNDGSINKICSDPKSLYVIERDIMYSKYNLYIKKWMNKLGKKHIYTVIFENMIKRPKKVLDSITSKIGIEDSFYNDYSFDHVNSSYIPKSRTIHEVFQAIGSFIPRGIVRTKIKRYYASMVSQNKANLQWSEIDDKVFKELQKYFAKYNRRLSKIVETEIPKGSTWQM